MRIKFLDQSGNGRSLTVFELMPGHSVVVVVVYIQEAFFFVMMIFFIDWRCQDAIANCFHYVDDLCTNPDYSAWVDLNCRKFCGKCEYRCSFLDCM